MTNLTLHRQKCRELLTGLEKEWVEYLNDFIDNTQSERELFIPPARPMILQLRNPAVVIKEEDGSETIASGCVWLIQYTNRTKEIIVPEETSGVLLERSTGRLLKNYNGLPYPLPDNVESLMRINLRITGDETSINWRLYKHMDSKYS